MNHGKGGDVSTHNNSVSILHSNQYTNILYKNFHHVHKDRDVLFSSLLYYYGFVKERPSFLQLVRPQMARRKDLESFHDCDYLDLLECYHKGDYNDEHHEHENELVECDGERACILQNQSSATKQKLPENISKLDQNKDIHSILDSYGLTDDCPLPTKSQLRANLWEYCLFIAGASIQAAGLLLHTNTNVAINFGGGRHHAHHNKAGGFCYVNDVVLAIQRLLREHRLVKSNDARNAYQFLQPQQQQQQRHQHHSRCRVLYLDLDIHHCDGVQSAFYETEEVLTISLHRYTPGFFPSTTGSTKEKGKYQTSGVGYNLNIPMPRSCTNIDFVIMWKRILRQILPNYDPDYVVVCVGADGLRDDDLVKDTCEGWNLTPEGIAYCVKLLALQCAGQDVVGIDEKESSTTCTSAKSLNDSAVVNQKKDQAHTTRTLKKRKILVLGGGGYNPTNTARSFLLCTAAACEGARPGILNELPKDIPKHEYFSHYGPSFELYSKEAMALLHRQCKEDGNKKPFMKNTNVERTDEYKKTIKEGIEAINLQEMFLGKNACQQNIVIDNFRSQDTTEDFDSLLLMNKKDRKNKRHSRSRRKRKFVSNK